MTTPLVLLSSFLILYCFFFLFFEKKKRIARKWEWKKGKKNPPRIVGTILVTCQPIFIYFSFSRPKKKISSFLFFVSFSFFPKKNCLFLPNYFHPILPTALGSFIRSGFSWFCVHSTRFFLTIFTRFILSVFTFLLCLFKKSSLEFGRNNFPYILPSALSVECFIQN